jgi:hypothetical protein
MSDVEMTRIPAGSVLRGDQRGEERREIEVDSFELGAYPVTEEQMAEVSGSQAQILSPQQTTWASAAPMTPGAPASSFATKN